MKFDQVLTLFTTHFDAENIRWALVGGLALQAWGYSRFTHDIDIAVEGRHREQVLQFAESVGYETLHVSEGHSNHLHPSDDLGRVDFMYVHGETAEKVFDRARVRPIVGEFSGRVASPEHLAAMKGIAMKNAPRRVLIDSPDVEFLLSVEGVDREEIRNFYARHGLLELFDAISRHSR
jgi:hypothetical protein